MQDSKMKSMIEFDAATSVKSIGFQKNPNIKVTTRFMKGKMLMFTKTSLISFVYDMIDVFYFPENHPKVQAIYKKYKIQKCFLYQNLIDADSTSLFFIFVCDLDCQLNKKESRIKIFEVMICSKVVDRLDLSDKFWEQFGVFDPTLIKQVGLYEIESIKNANIATVVVNPKEYFEKYKDKNTNKKHKGLKKDTS